uniref:Tryptophan synthase beta chain 1 n=1 Tax=Lygus hesperus TaxID=30085 RepID=A0A0A9VWX4_LYGHE
MCSIRENGILEVQLMPSHGGDSINFNESFGTVNAVSANHFFADTRGHYGVSVRGEGLENTTAVPASSDTADECDDERSRYDGDDGEQGQLYWGQWKAVRG